MDDDLNAIFPPPWAAPDGPWARQADGLYVGALHYERRPRWDGDGGLQWLHEPSQVAGGDALAAADRGEYELLLARLADPGRGAFRRASVAAWDRAVRGRRRPLGRHADPDALAGLVARLAAMDPRVQGADGAVDCVFCAAQIVASGTLGALHELRRRATQTLPLGGHARACVWRDAVNLVSADRIRR